jgi:hypothetical protein
MAGIRDEGIVLLGLTTQNIVLHRMGTRLRAVQTYRRDNTRHWHFNIVLGYSTVI